MTLAMRVICALVALAAVAYHPSAAAAADDDAVQNGRDISSIAALATAPQQANPNIPGPVDETNNVVPRDKLLARSAARRARAIAAARVASIAAAASPLPRDHRRKVAQEDSVGCGQRTAGGEDV